MIPHWVYTASPLLRKLMVKASFHIGNSEFKSRLGYVDWQEYVKRLLALGENHPRYVQELAAILEKEKGAPILVYPSILHWGHPLFQRPHQILREMAKRGVTVFFCNPDPRFDDVQGFKEVAPHLYLAESISVLTPLKQKPVWIWLGWTGYTPILRFFENTRVIYELIDDLQVFGHYCGFMEKEHAQLVKSSDVVLASADRLLNDLTAVRNDVLLVTNGVAVEDFAEDSNPLTPDDMKDIVAQGKPVVGYYGAIARWLDYDLIAEACKALPDMEFVFIGPDHEGASSKLEQAANSHWLGPKPYAELKHYLACFDVATIPFRIDKVTHAVSPLKLFEYMAGGKPVVARDLEEMRKYPQVLRARDAREWVEKIREAISLGKDEKVVRELRRAAEANSWASKVDQVLKAMAEVDQSVMGER